MYVVKGSACLALSLAGVTIKTRPQTIQALVYFAKAVGVDFGYRFGWQAGRIVSLDLAVDWDDWREGPDTATGRETWELRPIMEPIEDVLSVIKDETPHSLAIMMAVHFLQEAGRCTDGISAWLYPICGSEVTLQTVSRLDDLGWLARSTAREVPMVNQATPETADMLLCQDAIRQYGDILGKLGYQLNFTIQQLVSAPPMEALCDEPATDQPAATRRSVRSAAAA
jgi:hypothetical protein